MNSLKLAKLHIGCGANLLDGWINSDHEPTKSNVLKLDATKAFPFQNDSLDYVFSEHMIEHISYNDGKKMLSECFRTLKKGGKIRITTPNLQFLIDLYSEPKTVLQQNYINWASNLFIKDGLPTDVFVINNFVRDWGHLFIYDFKTLNCLLRECGFMDVSSFALNQSMDNNLENLEFISRLPPGFLQLESMSLEATKPI